MNKMTQEEKKQIKKKRKVIDNLYNSVTFASSFVGAISLVAIFVFVITKGYALVNLDIILGDYTAPEYHLEVTAEEYCYCEEPTNLDEGDVFSTKWGVAFGWDTDKEGRDIVVIKYLDENSPLLDATDIYGEDDDVWVREGLKFNRITIYNGTTRVIQISKYGPEELVDVMEEDGYNIIEEIYLSGDGGGIRGSLLSTVYLIFLTLIFALPLGIFTAIYLNEYAKKGKITNYLRQLIEMLTGVPSIIFGLVGLAVIIPLTETIKIGGESVFAGRNMLAAALTMAIVIVPTIIRSTEESLKVIPVDLRQASLALGANNTQTTFKVVLPNALPGILTATLLGIGRIIGESAALIFVLGTTISDRVSISEPATTLAVQIWTVMGGETANFELASAISIIILGVVLVLNLTVKYISHRLNKAWH